MALDLLFYVLLVGWAFGIFYLGGTLLAVRRFTRTRSAPATWRPPVTVLKPLCGDEPQLYDNLRSFCEQDYPDFQIVFGVTDSSGPAAGVVRQLIADLPGADLALAADAPILGPNNKVGKLEMMMRSASHDIIVIADSDIRVQSDYLARIVPPLTDPAVGLVTCLFTGRPGGSVWSRLGAMWFNYGFLPSVLFSRLLGLQIGCFGATMVLRRETLDRIGGFASIRDQLADDYALGDAVRRGGQRVEISNCMVDTTVAETRFTALFQRELRWGRTIRSLAPAGHAASAITNPAALAALALLVPGYQPAALLMLGLALLLRMWTMRRLEKALGLERAPFSLVPVREALSFLVLVTSLRGSGVVWRERKLRVVAGGRLQADDCSP